MITTEQASQFLDDFQASDLLAIQQLKSTTMKPSALYMYLEALENLNEIMMLMELGDLEWTMEFNDLYRNAIGLLYDKCEQILKED